ncbi:MAG: hypothetical protein HQL48_05720 [Gammaproteobacteria bacterium]|nr:hypothetical protein [Gammaproteobacteria bacterium]
MSQPANKQSLSFFAADAFAYVKTYDSLRPKSLDQIRALKDRFEKQFWEGGNMDPNFDVKIHAYNDAISSKLEGKEPGLVQLDSEGGLFQETQNKLQEQEELINTLKKELMSSQGKLQQANSSQSGMEQDIERKTKIIKELQHRIGNLHDVIRISGIAAMMIFFILLYMIVWS